MPSFNIVVTHTRMHCLNGHLPSEPKIFLWPNAIPERYDKLTLEERDSVVFVLAF